MKPQLNPEQLDSKSAAGGALPIPAATVRDRPPVPPSSSVTVSVTV